MMKNIPQINNNGEPKAHLRVEKRVEKPVLLSRECCRNKKMALLASSLLSARVMFYVLRLVVVWAIRKGKFTSPNSILPHGLQVLDTPALTSEKDDIQRTSIRTLEKIAGLNVVHHHDPKNTTEEIFPKQQLILQSQMKCVCFEFIYGHTNDLHG